MFLDLIVTFVIFGRRLIKQVNNCLASVNEMLTITSSAILIASKMSELNSWINATTYPVQYVNMKNSQFPYKSSLCCARCPHLL